MVKIETKEFEPLLSTKNYESFGNKYLCVDSGLSDFPSGQKIHLNLQTADKKMKKCKFILNRTNMEYIQNSGFSDTEDLHGRFIEIGIDETVKFMGKTVGGLVITNIELPPIDDN